MERNLKFVRNSYQTWKLASKIMILLQILEVVLFFYLRFEK